MQGVLQGTNECKVLQTIIKMPQLEEFLKGACVYKCALCDIGLMYDSIIFWMHVRRVHTMDAEQYKTASGNDYYIKFEFVRCKMCGHLLKSDRGKWMRHVRFYHYPMELLEYFYIFEHEFEE